jgi:hypothetical protein
MAAKKKAPPQRGAHVRTKSGATLTRICIDEDCPNCDWPERWADLDLADAKRPTLFGCNKCEYRSTYRND